MADKAIILAAGRGSRMEKFTDNNPKCLVEIDGKRLIDWQIESLKNAGISDIIVIRGYLGEMINGDFQTFENNRWDKTNMFSTLLLADEVLKHNNCIISYSDILYHYEHVKQLDSAKEDICITYDQDWESLWRLRFEDPLVDAETFFQSGGFLKEIGKKANVLDSIKGQYMGLIKMTPQGWKIIKELISGMSQNKIDKLDMTKLFNILLKNNVKIHTVPVSGKWCEVDSFSDLIKYKLKLEGINKGGCWSHDWRY